MGRVSPELRLVKPSPAPERWEPVDPFDEEALFRRFAPYVAAVALRMLGRRQEVEDVVQDVFIEAHKGLRGLRDPKAVKGWLATITLRVTRRRLRKRRLRGFVGLDEVGHYEEIVDESADPEQRALVAAVYRKLDQLPTELRLAWTLRVVEEEELRRVAELCGCSLATVKRRITRASVLLREVLDDA